MIMDSDVREDFYKNIQWALLKSKNLSGSYISETHIANTR